MYVYTYIYMYTHTNVHMVTQGLYQQQKDGRPDRSWRTGSGRRTQPRRDRGGGRLVDDSQHVPRLVSGSRGFGSDPAVGVLGP